MAVNGDSLAPGAAAAAVWAALVQALRAQSWFIALVLVYLVAGFGVAGLYGHDLSLGLYGRLQAVAFLNFAAAFLAGRALWTVLRHRPARPLGFVWADLMGACGVPRRLAGALPALVLLPLATSAFTSLKTLIPVIRPFDWDARLAALDAALHGGRQPWELLQPLLGSPAVTRWVDLVYGPPWFWMLLLMQFWMIVTLDAERQRFLLTFLLSWLLLGNVLATLLSSAGPVYYGHFAAGADPFAPLLSYLQGVAAERPLLAVEAQDYLWRAHLGGDLTVGVGVSAMPSMHISMAFLFFLMIRRLHWALGLAAGLYVAALVVGSVHLAWHYAVDGYAAIALTYALWRAVGWALARSRARRLRPRPQAALSGPRAEPS